MKAKLFKFIPILLQKSTTDSSKFVLKQPVEIQAKNYLGNLKLKLPAFITNLLAKKLIIKNLIWTKKPNETIIETELNLQPIFKKVENYIKLEEATLTVTTDLEVIIKNG